jgi:hypothetical protein
MLLQMMEEFRIELGKLGGVGIDQGVQLINCDLMIGIDDVVTDPQAVLPLHHRHRLCSSNEILPGR